MKNRPIRDVAASVKQRLLNLARQQKEELEYCLMRYGLDRLLYRLSCSSYRDEFVVKGASLFPLWGTFPRRVTRDLDLLGHGTPTLERLSSVFKDLCDVDIQMNDGLLFDPQKISAERIRKDNKYLGVRLRLQASLGNARLHLQVDVGFGDAVPACEAELPGLLDLPRPRLRVYPPEFSIAEKFEALMTLGFGNTRMKDFYDIWLLANGLSFEEAVLCAALRQTLARRQQALPSEMPLALTPVFYEDVSKLMQWRAFLRRAGSREDSPTLETAVSTIRAFLMPPLDTLRQESLPVRVWKPGGPWLVSSDK